MKPWQRPALALAALLALGAWLLADWQPARQVGKLSARLLDAAAARDWKRLERLMDESYRDAWHANRSDALESARMLGQNFLVLEIRTRKPPIVAISGSQAQWSAPLDFLGRGNAVGQALLDQAAALSEPFTLTWRRTSWRPWDWKLTSASQPEIAAIDHP